MGKTTKTLLGLTIASVIAGLVIASGLVNVGSAVSLYVLPGVGATFLGLFLIAKLLEKETARYDQEQQALKTTTKSADPTQAPALADARAGSTAHPEAPAAVSAAQRAER